MYHTCLSGGKHREPDHAIVADLPVIGVVEKAISPKSVKVKGSPIKFSGTVSMAWADAAIVSGPGQR
jgi:hypothetical protein